MLRTSQRLLLRWSTAVARSASGPQALRASSSALPRAVPSPLQQRQQQRGEEDGRGLEPALLDLLAGYGVTSEYLLSALDKLGARTCGDLQFLQAADIATLGDAASLVQVGRLHAALRDAADVRRLQQQTGRAPWNPHSAAGGVSEPLAPAAASAASQAFAAGPVSRLPSSVAAPGLVLPWQPAAAHSAIHHAAAAAAVRVASLAAAASSPAAPELAAAATSDSLQEAATQQPSQVNRAAHLAAAKAEAAEAAEAYYLEDLRAAHHHSLVNNFTCGGAFAPREPITLWFSAARAADACDISRAAAAEARAALESAAALRLPCFEPLSLQTLLQACQLAAFGRGSETVVDKAVRKAGQLGPSAFACSFDLPATRILEDVRDVLLGEPGRGVTAELHKLNVHRPGDHFQAHVDTPRGAGTFATLVVCLPQPFTGGQLAVRHAGDEVIHVWAGNAAAAAPSGDSTAAAHATALAAATAAAPAAASATQQGVQWAAFYADCEHEVLPVTAGCRITLTYLLRAHATAADQPRLNAVDPHTLPLHQALARALASPLFMPDGGCIGFPCRHAYSFSGSSDKKRVSSSDLQRSLKGSDRVLWAAIAAAGLQPRLQASPDEAFVAGYKKLEDEDQERWDRRREKDMWIEEMENGQEGGGEARLMRAARYAEAAEAEAAESAKKVGQTLLLTGFDMFKGEQCEQDVFLRGVAGWHSVVWMGAAGTDAESFFGVYDAWAHGGDAADLQDAYASLAVLALVPPAKDRKVQE